MSSDACQEADACREADDVACREARHVSCREADVVVDGDEGVPLSECIRISRNVEHNLDREAEDFALEVSTPDISKPIKLQRQYIKNINRILNVKTVNEEEIEGTLVAVNEENIVLVWDARVPKLEGKGKMTVEQTATIEYKNIKEAKVKIVF